MQELMSLRNWGDHPPYYWRFMEVSSPDQILTPFPVLLPSLENGGGGAENS